MSGQRKVVSDNEWERMQKEGLDSTDEEGPYSGEGSEFSKKGSGKKSKERKALSTLKGYITRALKEYNDAVREWQVLHRSTVDEDGKIRQMDLKEIKRIREKMEGLKQGMRKNEEKIEDKWSRFYKNYQILSETEQQKEELTFNQYEQKKEDWKSEMSAHIQQMQDLERELERQTEEAVSKSNQHPSPTEDESQQEEETEEEEEEEERELEPVKEKKRKDNIRKKPAIHKPISMKETIALEMFKKLMKIWSNNVEMLKDNISYGNLVLRNLNITREEDRGDVTFTLEEIIQGVIYKRDAVKEATERLEREREKLSEGCLQQIYDTYMNEWHEAEDAVEEAKKVIASIQVYIRRCEEGKRQQRSDDDKCQKGREYSRDRSEEQGDNFRIKIQPIQIPTFSGVSWEWDNFYTIFNNNIHSRKIDNITKYNYLLNALSGDAKEAVQHLRISDSNYHMAIQILQEKYGSRDKIRRQLNQRLKHLKAESDSTKSSRKLWNTVVGICEQLTELGESMNNQMFLQTILEKMSKKINKKYVEKFIEEDCSWNWNHMRCTIEKIICTMEKVEDNLNIEGTYTSSSTTDQPVRGMFKKEESRKECWFCKRIGHMSDECRTVPRSDDRWKIFKESNRCRKCGSQNHMRKECKSTSVCKHCKKEEHHSSLCHFREVKSPEQQGTPESRSQSQGSTNWNPQPFRPTGSNATPLGKPPVVTNTVMTTTEEKKDKVYLLTGYADVYGEKDREKITTPILFDTASTLSFIDKELAEELELKEERSIETTIKGFTDKPKRLVMSQVKVKIRTEDGDIEVMLHKKDNITGKFTMASIDLKDRDFIKEHEIRIKKEQSQGDQRRSAGILIGQDLYDRFISKERRIELPSGLLATRANIGWLISGRREGKKRNETEDVEKNSESVYLCSNDNETDIKLNEWMEGENRGIEEQPGKSLDEKEGRNKKILEDFDSSIERRDDGYYVQMPWKSNKEELPDNKGIALCRLQSTYRAIANKPEVLEEYNRIFKEQLEKGIIERIDISKPSQGIVHYLPHQAVITPLKTTTKVRIVFDASARKRHTPSLNQVLHQGPGLVPDMYGMLLRWRMSPIAVTSDVEKAFLQIKLKEDNRDCTRFYWLRDHKRPPDFGNLVVYRYTRVTFGLICSPFLLAATLRYHFLHNEENRELAKEIINNIYVDNLIITANTRDEAKDKCQKAKETFDKMSMNLREFLSNCESTLESLRPEDKSEKKIQKVLGIEWNSEKDSMSVSSVISNEEATTKRKVASQLATIYDPMGFLLPVTLKGKLFLQELWSSDYDWDTKLKKEEVDRWNVIKEEISLRKEFTRAIPGQGESRLVICCDASNTNMAACGYLCNGSESNLIFAKLKLQSVRSPYTIPKMEMIALTMGCRMARYLTKELESTLAIKDVVILTDSEIALSWLKKEEEKQDSRLIINRRKEIVRLTGQMIEEGLTVSYGYIETKRNPADHATRGFSKYSIDETNWMKGERFFTEEKSNWPKTTRLHQLDRVEQDDGQDQVLNTVQLSTDTKIQWRITNSMRKLARIYVHVLRFINRSMRGLSAGKERILRENIPELDDIQLRTTLEDNTKIGKQLLVRIAQQDMKKDKGSLKMYQNLNLGKDQKGIYRCRGRLGNTDMKEESKFPIFVNNEWELASLIINDCHGRFHKGTNHTMATVRNEYWIPKLRSQVKKITRRCVTCQRINGLPYKYPDSPMLPAARVRRSRTFKHTGLDYFGPLIYRQEEDKKKAYGCLFTCLTTRLVHIELVESLSTTSFVNAVRRFISRRGVPSSILSDNATTFTLGEKVLHEAFKRSIDSTEAKGLGQTEEFEWKFITPLSPWKGGVYERLVKEIKISMQKSIGNRKLSREELETVLTEVEATLNSRPLTYQGTDLEHSRTIRPVDFIQKEMSLTLDLHLDEEESMGNEYLPPEELLQLRTQKEVQEALSSSVTAIQKFWTVWEEDYIKTLREQHRKQLIGKRGNKTPKEGDVVIVRDPGLSRNQWKLAIVMEVIRKGEEIWEVKVKTSTGRLARRSVNFLIPLEIEAKVDDKIESQPNEITKRIGHARRCKDQNINYNESDSESEDIVNIVIDEIDENRCIYDNLYVPDLLSESYSLSLKLDNICNLRKLILHVMSNNSYSRMSDIPMEMDAGKSGETEGGAGELTVSREERFPELWKSLVETYEESGRIRQEMKIKWEEIQLKCEKIRKEGRGWENAFASMSAFKSQIAYQYGAQQQIENLLTRMESWTSGESEIKIASKARELMKIEPANVWDQLCQTVEIFYGKMQAEMETERDDKKWRKLTKVEKKLDQILEKLPSSSSSESSSESENEDEKETHKPEIKRMVEIDKESSQADKEKMTITVEEELDYCEDIELDTSPIQIRNRSPSVNVSDLSLEEIDRIDSDEETVQVGGDREETSTRNVSQVVDREGRKEMRVRVEPSQRHHKQQDAKKMVFQEMSDFAKMEFKREDEMRQKHPSVAERRLVTRKTGINNRFGCRFCRFTRYDNQHKEEACPYYPTAVERMRRIMNLDTCVICLDKFCNRSCKKKKCDHCGTESHYRSLCHRPDEYNRLKKNNDRLRREMMLMEESVKESEVNIGKSVRVGAKERVRASAKDRVKGWGQTWESNRNRRH